MEYKLAKILRSELDGPIRNDDRWYFHLDLEDAETKNIKKLIIEEGVVKIYGLVERLKKGDVISYEKQFPSFCIKSASGDSNIHLRRGLLFYKIARIENDVGRKV